jgi:DNA-directed RNA polymerase alpha subunit
MKREDLIALGITDEKVLDQVMALHGKGIEKFKSDAGAAQEQIKALTTQVDEAGKAIQALKDLKPEEMKVAADEWQKKAEQAQKDAAAQVESVRFDYALREALRGHKVKDPTDLIPQLNRDLLKLDGETFIGLDEQIKRLKDAKGYLFDSDEPVPQFVKPGGGKSTPAGNALSETARKFAGLKDPAETQKEK